MRAFPHIRAFARREDGAVLAEFVLVLPLMLIFFGVTIEAARTFWAYQATIAGVRDATRYVARVEDMTICNDPGASLDGWQATVTDMVRNASDGTLIFPASITVPSVTAALTCASGDYRAGTVPVVTVTAFLDITFPFARVFELAGLTLPTASTQVSDQGRIFGT